MVPINKYLPPNVKMMSPKVLAESQRIPRALWRRETHWKYGWQSQKLKLGHDFRLIIQIDRCKSFSFQCYRLKVENSWNSCLIWPFFHSRHPMKLALLLFDKMEQLDWIIYLYRSWLTFFIIFALTMIKLFFISFNWITMTSTCSGPVFRTQWLS